MGFNLLFVAFVILRHALWQITRNGAFVIASVQRRLVLPMGLLGLCWLQDAVRNSLPAGLSLAVQFGLILPALMFVLLWQASILATIYGHFTERRDLRA